MDVVSHIMDLGLNPQELTQLQSFLDRIQNSTNAGQGTGNVVAATAATHPIAAASANHIITPAAVGPRLLVNSNHPVTPATVGPHSLVNSTLLTNFQQTSVASSGQIQPYQSVRLSQSLPAAPQGHPSPTMAISATGPIQPFLGRNSLGVSMAGQVNQEHRASAAANLPRRPPHAARHRGRGPAISAPSLACAPSVHDCLFNIPDEHGGTTVAIRIKIKVYPPQVYKSITCCLLATDVAD
jgi:hypothetical protein